MGDPTNPFEAPRHGDERRQRIPTDEGIEHEPHLRLSEFRLDPSEPAAWRAVSESSPDVTDPIDHSVWEEPSLSSTLTGPRPADALTYEVWLDRQVARTTIAQSWRVTVLVACAAGLCGVIGTFMNGNQQNGLLGVMLVGPFLEEIMKVALALWVVEKRPYLFQSAMQIALCAAAGGLMFAVIENLLYLNVYIPNPSADLIAWRWTICVMLHVGCSLTAGFGLIRIWRECMTTRRPPRLATGIPLIIVAILIHALYNTATVVFSMSGF